MEFSSAVKEVRGTYSELWWMGSVILSVASVFLSTNEF